MRFFAFALALAAVAALFIHNANRSASSQTCRRLAATRVFSHCGRARGVASGESAVVTAGRVEAMYGRGIAAFDMDIFWSTGGTLYVGHPRLLREEFGRDPFEWSDAQVPRGTLTVEKLLDLAGELPRLTLALDLKGSTYDAYHTYLARLRDMVARRRLQRRAWIWVDSAEAVAALGPSNGVRFGRPLYDRGDAAADCASQLEAADARRFEFLGPSATCASARFFAAAAAAPWRRAPRHLLVWT